MSNPYLQQHQELEIKEPTKSLVIGAIEGEETLSEPFSYRLTLYSSRRSIPPADLLGKGVTVLIRQNAHERPLHGRVRRFSQSHRIGDLTVYRMEIVPSLWMLSLSSDCRHWEDKTVLEITKDVFQRLGVRDYKLSCSKTYPLREFCVQYNETHLDFLSRLWEEEGIFYSFTHAENVDTVVLSDDSSSLPASKFVPKLQTATTDPFTIDVIAEDVHVEHNVHSHSYVLQDYDFERTSGALTATAVSQAEASNGERFEYAGPWLIPNFNDRIVRTRVEHEEAMHTVVTGSTVAVLLQPGTSVELHDAPNADGTMPLNIIGTRLSCHIGGYGSGATTSLARVEFTAIPRKLMYRPPRKTAKPRMHGAQTAMVFTESGEDITTDKYGRVRVQFYWDRTHAKTCWVRLSSAWAGSGLGFVQVPRAGDEVVVDFLDGDPDRPIITGRVYNAGSMPPLNLPGEKSKSGFKSRSLSKGSAHNELWLDDTKDSEKVGLYAGKDYDTVVKNDCTKTVKEGKDDTTIEKGDQSLTLKQGSQKVVVHKDRNVTVETGNDTTKITQGNLQIELSAGNVTIKASAGKMAFEAMQGIELKVGANSMKIAPSGVEIAGTTVKVEGQAMTQIKAPITQVNADGMLTLKGSMTMVN